MRYICLVIHYFFLLMEWIVNKTITIYFKRYMQSHFKLLCESNPIYIPCEDVKSKWWCTYYYNTAKRKRSRTIKFLKLFNNCYHLHVIEKVLYIYIYIQISIFTTKKTQKICTYTLKKIIFLISDCVRWSDRYSTCLRNRSMQIYIFSGVDLSTYYWMNEWWSFIIG